MATIALNIAKNQLIDYAKNQLIDYAKKELINQLQEKLQDGETGIENAFKTLKETLEGLKVTVPIVNKEINVVQTIRDGICVNLKLAEEVKTALKEKIEGIKFSEELEKMPEDMKKKMPEEIKKQIIALSETLKSKLKTLIDDIIICVPQSASTNSASTNSASTDSASTNSTGGSNQRDRKQKRRRKTKKNSHKRSRGRKRHSRK